MIYAQRNYLVVGGSGHLGQALCRHLLDGGGRVFATALRNAERLDPLREHFPDRFTVFPGVDVRDAAAVDALGVELRRRVDRLDGVIYTVGPFLQSPLSEVDAAQLTELLATNIVGGFSVARATFELLARRGGGARLIYFTCAGTEASRAWKYTAAYSIAKGGLAVLVKSLAGEWAPKGIAVNAIAPGVIASGDHVEAPLAYREDPVLAVPMGRLGSSVDILAAVDFLLSPGAAYVTGTILPVAGGFML